MTQTNARLPSDFFTPAGIRQHSPQRQAVVGPRADEYLQLNIEDFQCIHHSKSASMNSVCYCKKLTLRKPGCSGALIGKIHPNLCASKSTGKV
ncbi:hypothetical protein KW849_18865 [Pseudomonas sp. PDM26]|uniref:hypothetical protein n=1 Tax=Pseudomonas sp. PDM26 TaxID=2854766 RepID=UPI001C474603|nr:hypothetical protein [Pseudomonas sp. PDM26]MBV7548347.1 hypothetical protein [Pseudomonas sp. PDM26]